MFKWAQQTFVASFLARHPSSRIPSMILADS